MGVSTRTSRNETLPITDINQFILEQVYDIYNQKYGICEISHIHNLGIAPPKKKIWIMLLGNHSAGKSSYINWYAEETVQKTAVSIETTGFSFIQSGKKKQTLQGPATLQLYPFLNDLMRMRGIKENINTEIVTSRAKKIHLLTLIDTPGLVDGDAMQYSFDPEEVMLILAKECDLIFTFFDPIGQALCQRTMHIVESLSKKYPSKLHFYLSKSDQVPDETDRQRVLIQIAQNVSQKIPNNFSLNIPTIYLPSPDNENNVVRNHIDETLKEIDRAILLKVQSVLDDFKSDCNLIIEVLEKKLLDDKRKVEFISLKNRKGFSDSTFLVFVLFALFYLLIILEVAPRMTLEMLIPSYATIFLIVVSYSYYRNYLDMPETLTKTHKKEISDQILYSNELLTKQKVNEY
ncbi:hypothetical protein HK099_000184 [Clydaea vesicula]|uniref:G domain-containing protein n=1 Tax=Clydaea vesicula TaxID=447962 RepID=A0AAD5Y044_9FUNG|nr:hypothetical protein HK099_000184 [Clydaea vesicula]